MIKDRSQADYRPWGEVRDGYMGVGCISETFDNVLIHRLYIQEVQGSSL